jgi:hypothetical protein
MFTTKTLLKAFVGCWIKENGTESERKAARDVGLRK